MIKVMFICRSPKKKAVADCIKNKQKGLIGYRCFCSCFWALRATKRPKTRSAIKTNVLRGGFKKNATKVACICRSPENKAVTYFFFPFFFLFFSFFFRVSMFVYRVFGCFVTRGVHKHDKQISKKSIRAHHKKCSFFLLRFFFLALGYFARFLFIAFLGVS
jgi:hypothetical protein